MLYEIKHKTDKETGTFPQALCSTQFHAHQLACDTFPPFEPKLEFELDNKAKVTDVLSQAAISAHGLLVNERFKRLLDGFQVMRHRYYPVLVRTRNAQLPYFWLHMVDHFDNRIDYAESSFYWTRSTFRKGQIVLASYDDYLEKKKENGHLWGVSVDKVRLTDDFNRDLDLFSCLPFDMGIYASERLCRSVVANGITGVELNESARFI